MSFTPEHIEILERHREHWDTLTQAGYIRNLDEPVKKQLQQVYWEAVGPQRFTLWCGDCVADLVRQLYTQYEQWEGYADEPETNEVTVIAEGFDPAIGQAETAVVLFDTLPGSTQPAPAAFKSTSRKRKRR